MRPRAATASPCSPDCAGCSCKWPIFPCCKAHDAVSVEPSRADRSVARHWERARTYLQQRNLPAASVQLESLRALAPDDAHTHALTAQFFLMQGRPHDAATHALAAAQAV